MKIVNVRAIPLSYLYPKPAGTLALGTSFKKDTVIVKVTAESGQVGFGESHHSLSATAVAEYINMTLAGIVEGMDVFNSEGIWQRAHRRTVRSHSLASGALIALSGIDIAIWDLKGKILNVPLYQLLGGARRPITSYCGSVTMGFLNPPDLEAEVRRIIDLGGFRAVKIRVGDTVRKDLERVWHIRSAFGQDLAIMVDANTGYDVVDLYQLLPGLGEAAVTWLEEPYAPDDVDGLAELRHRSPVPIAAGENLYGRAAFNPLLSARAIDVLQPDPSKCGGVTELKKIADLAELHHLRLAPHASVTALNYAASLHVLSSTSAGYYFESAVPGNPFIEDVIRAPVWPTDGTVTAPNGPGLGVEVDESRFDDFTAIAGPSYRWS